ncbi:hypothetical protein FRACYDRAFT_242349 [Fragilariopsis cylindrus CCMP1102]|uniref:Uncharacterized protein n=1 Tax=Fragilariopsis cylindrus CCMP1102 TaxID=635003 RepID=A0A1E7F755_9STRA|nr:hypothetical protein FRACYDRAFT_242349 [Fragilariopsis cylindrus CCMP1102]|eukprot:OEU13996.1 hypothetical protein FRACYDRAFT_242349 [Fragilariopsis cylindrus CCMP1102]
MSSDDNSDLNVIARLERQENFDDNLEDIHAALSKRDTIRQSLPSRTSSNRSSGSSRRNTNSNGEDDDEKDENRRSVNKSHKRPSSSRRLSLEIENEKQSPRPRRNKDSRQQHRSSRTLSLPSIDNLSLNKSLNNVNGGEHRRHSHHRQSSRRKISQEVEDNNQKSNPSDERPVRSASVIEELLQVFSAAVAAESPSSTILIAIAPATDTRGDHYHEQEERTGGEEIQKMMDWIRITFHKLSKALDEIEIIKNQQRKELTELSDTSRDLARANIDHAKSVDEARILKAELDRFKNSSVDRDGKISTLEEELRISVENTTHLEADVLYADDQINKLEKEIKTFEEQVAAYRNAAERDSRSAQVEPQALFLAAAVQKKATANGNGPSWRGIFTKSSENEDETQAMIGNLENENSKQGVEIKTLKSEMVKMQSKYKEQAYNKKQHFDQLLKEKEAIELTNANLLKELELARKMNQMISNSDK